MFDHLVDRLLLAGFRWQAHGAMTFREEVPLTPRPPRAGVASLYVHVPFCEALCPFCSFHRVEFRAPKARRYFEALREELRRYHQAGFRFSSVYVGGGTPTVAPDELVETLELVKALYGVGEISVETNPRDLSLGVLEKLQKVGVSRLSVGVQSFDDRLLREMERYTKYGPAAEIIEHLAAAAPCFPTLNVDMIFNLPHQDEASLRHDLDVILGLEANQVSFYPLMVTRSTALAMAKTMGTPDRRRLRRFYDLILGRLRPAFEPQSAWCFARGAGAIDEYVVDAEDYVGVGSGAFSYVDGALSATTFSINEYCERIASGQTAVTSRRTLSEDERIKHAFLMKLFGLSLSRQWALDRYGDHFFSVLAPAVAVLKGLGALVEDEASYRLTNRGMYYWTLMMAAFYEEVNRFREQMRAHLRRFPCE